MCHETCRRHRSRISLAGVKLSQPPSLLSALEYDCCNKLPQSAVACKPVYGGMWCVGHVFSRADPPLLLRSTNTQAECLQKGSNSFGWGRHWVGARLTVAHKRISPPHKDSGPLLSLTRSTKELTFVCLSGRRGCGRTVQAGGRRGWHWWWGYNDRRGG